jgi:hypothetical protein
MERIGLNELTGGALQEKFQCAMDTVLRNMQDPNTPWKNKRSITIKLVFSQNEDRDDTDVDISVDTKTAPVKPIATRMAIGKDLETGEVYAHEYGSQIRGQMSFMPDPSKSSELMIDGQMVNTTIGEVTETEKVLDFRAAREA